MQQSQCDKSLQIKLLIRLRMNKKLSRIIIALDHPSIEEAVQFVESINPKGKFFKIGLGHVGQAYTKLIRLCQDKGANVFLDFKLFDIPSTIERSVKPFFDLGIDFMTFHGDPNVIESAANATI